MTPGKEDPPEYLRLLAALASGKTEPEEDLIGLKQVHDVKAILLQL